MAVHSYSVMSFCSTFLIPLLGVVIILLLAVGGGLRIYDKHKIRQAVADRIHSSPKGDFHYEETNGLQGKVPLRSEELKLGSRTVVDIKNEPSAAPTANGS